MTNKIPARKLKNRTPHVIFQFSIIVISFFAGHVYPGVTHFAFPEVCFRLKKEKMVYFPNISFKIYTISSIHCPRLRSDAVSFFLLLCAAALLRSRLISQPPYFASQPPYFAAASAPRAYSSSSSLSMSSLGKRMSPFSTLQPSI